MTRANTEQIKHTPWFAKAGAACSIVPIARFVSPNIFALKGGGYGCLFSLTGIDEESVTDLELDSRMRSIEGALRGLPEGSCLYQYTRVMSGFDLPRQANYTNPVTEVFASDRLDFLRQNAAFRRIDLHWCLTLEPSKAKAFERKPQENAIHTSRMLSDLEKTATILRSHLGNSLGLRLLDKTETFQFFSYLFNLEEWAEQDQLRSDTGVDRQIVKSPVAWHSDYVTVGKRLVQMFSLKTTPEASRPCLFSGLLTLDCDSLLCWTWRVKSTAAARKEIDSQEKFISFFKVGVLTRVMSGRDTASLETGAGAKAANINVNDLSDVIRGLDKKAQGEFSLRLLLAARSQEQLRDVVPAVHRIFVDARAQVMEETFGNLSGFYAMFPGNNKFNVYPLWLSEDHHARLSSVFAPSIGHPHSDDLDSEYLNIFETRTRTPFFQDVYVDGVRVMLIIGPTGSGKSVHGNAAIALEQKYGGFTYIFDIGGSYESVVELYGGRVDRVGKDGPRINPFSLEPTESNIKFLYSFIKLLLTNGGAELESEDDDVIHKAVQDMYLLDHENRRLSNLFLPKKLDRYLSKWVGKGIYNAVFDNVEDSLSLSRLQCFDFQGVNNDQHADLIEPLMVWLLRRINDVLYNPANLGVPKHILFEEIFSSMKNKQLLDGALASIKTVRKNLGGVTMIGQSADDLGANADSIVNSCTSFLFLKDVDFQSEALRRIVQDERTAARSLRELAGSRGLIHPSRRAHQGGDAAARQAQLRHVLYQEEGPCSPHQVDRKVRTHRGHHALCPGRDCVTNPTSTERTTSETAHHSHHPFGLGLAAAAHAATDQPHHLEPAAPRSVTVSEADAPPAIRTALLQSTLIMLPAEEKVANVFAGDTVNWVFDGGHVASRFISVKPKVANATTDIHIVSDHGNEYTLQLREVSSDADAHFDSKVFIMPDDKAAKDRLVELPVFVPVAELERAKQEAAEAKAAQTAELKAEDIKAETYRSKNPGTLHFDYTWDTKKGNALGLEQIWHDDKFTYLRGHFQETPALYEVKEKKPSLINFDFSNGLYTVPKELGNGYLAIGKQKVEFHRAEGKE